MAAAALVPYSTGDMVSMQELLLKTEGQKEEKAKHKDRPTLTFLWSSWEGCLPGCRAWLGD